MAPPDTKTSYDALFSLSSLRRSWQQIKKESRQASVRDAVDYLDWAVSIGATLPGLRRELLDGTFAPATPYRYELAKSKGAFRTITSPSLRDLIVYRTISDWALLAALPHKVPGAFFSRRHQATPIGNTLSIDPPADPHDYLRFFDIWMSFNEYRTRTLLSRPYEILVITDISNYFDSIAHDLLLEHLAPLGLPRKAMGVLRKMLEALKPTAGHSSNPQIGIPVDEYDCSRQLAHIFLFGHDLQIADRVGDTNYVRWMDDQSVGAKTPTEARAIVNAMTRSLASQRLTLNSGKTRFLAPSEVAEHFQLTANELLTEWEKNYQKITPSNVKEARAAFKSIWSDLNESDLAHKGNWDKIVKRGLGIVTKVDTNLLDRSAYNYLVDFPHLSERIFCSLARRNRINALLRLFDRYRCAGESLYESTESDFFDACLLLDAPPSDERRIRSVASEFARGKLEGQSGGAVGKVGAILCLYWFGAPARVLQDLFSGEEGPRLPACVARAWLAVNAAHSAASFRETQRHLVGHPSDDVARLSTFIDDLFGGRVDTVGNYKGLKSRWPLKGKYYDTRAWLQLELISHCTSPKVHERAVADAQQFKKFARTHQELEVLDRINANVATSLPAYKMKRR